MYFLPKRYTVTAALPYANGPVHIGHLAGVYLPADIYVRYLRAMHREVKFICGSDEHGVPITIRAQKEGVTPQQVVDKYHALIRDSFRDFNVSFDVYSRTSSATHAEVSSGFFTKLNDAENRNFGYRREFHRYVDSAAISTTSVLNGMFMDILQYGMPLLDFKARSVSYWGDADQLLDFTTMDDVGAYTAEAALDDAAPAVLRIAGDQQSPRQLAALATEVLGETFTLQYMGSTEEMAAAIQSVRLANPGSETEEFPRFQQMQYLHNMFTGRAKLNPLDNDRYPGMKWTTVRQLLAHRGG